MAVRAKTLIEVRTLLWKAQHPSMNHGETCTCLSCTLLPAVEEAIEREEECYHAGIDSIEYE